MNDQSLSGAPGAHQASAAATILIDAARCWRGARDAGDAIQPCLSRTLAAYDCVMLAPVLDSLVFFYESALGRQMVVGEETDLSNDEHLLLRLLEGTPGACVDCPEAKARPLNCALCSTRIMLALTLGHPPRMIQPIRN